MDAYPTSADELRDQLKGLLSDLDEEIRTSYPTSCYDLSRRTDVAEVSVVQDMACLVRRALLGERLSGDPRCTSSGQASDLRDSLAVCARDVRLERERREADLSSLQVLSWPQQLGHAFQQLMDEEEEVCTHLQEVCAFSRERAAALKAVVSDMSDVCLRSISDAMRAPSASEAHRRQIGVTGNQACEEAVARWLTWREASQTKQVRHWEACAPVHIPQVLTDAASREKQVAAFLSAIRTAMKLRRQQIRLVAVQTRLASVLASCDVYSSLLQSIQFSQ